MPTPIEKLGEDIVHTTRKSWNKYEQGIPTGRWGWITSFLRSCNIHPFLRCMLKDKKNGIENTLFLVASWINKNCHIKSRKLSRLCVGIFSGKDLDKY